MPAAAGAYRRAPGHIRRRPVPTGVSRHWIAYGGQRVLAIAGGNSVSVGKIDLIA